MSINGIGNSPYSTYNLFTRDNANNAANAETQERSESTKKSEKAQETRAEARKRTYGNSLHDQIRKQIDEMLEDVPRGEDGKLSFNDVFDYRKNLATEFHDSVDADLKKLGVDTDTNFTLEYNASSGKMIIGEHPDRDAIVKYFEDNPDKVKQFKRLTQFDSVTGTAEKKLSPMQLRRSLQASSMSAWVLGNADNSLFSGSLNSMLASMPGLNLKV